LNNVPLAAIPNQSLSTTLGGNQYDIALSYCGNGVMVIDLSINSVVILTGTRLVGNYPIIVSDYLENGNFILQTANYEYPDYTRFGIDQYLIYASQAEIEALNGNPS
jgi:hypothetical protein